MRKKRKTRSSRLSFTRAWRLWSVLIGFSTCVAACIVAWSFAWQCITTASVKLGFIFEDVHITGLKELTEERVESVWSDQRFGPMLSVSIHDIYHKLIAIPYVQSATVRRVWPSALYIHIVERVPVANWFHRNVWHLVSGDGTIIMDLQAPLKGYPLVSGEGAPLQISKLMQTINSYPNIKDHITGLSFVRNRRWNMMINQKMLVQLPAEDDNRRLDQVLSQLNHLMSIQKIRSDEIALVNCRMDDGKWVLKLHPGINYHISSVASAS